MIRCLHGLDRRFCAVCNRASRNTNASSPGAGSASVADVLAFLNDARTRATYGAVASVIGLPAQSVGQALGERRAEASWVVNDQTELPTGYEQTNWHPDLLASSSVIRTGNELALRLALWRAKRS